MVLLKAIEPVLVYRVMDGRGSSIGEVIQPSTKPVVGRGAGTVLLVRGESGSCQVAPGSATAASVPSRRPVLSAGRPEAPTDCR
jgi:hypothetical protein